MRTVVYTEDSETVDAEQADNALTYYQGSFRTVRILANKISPYTEVDIRILSQDRGIVDGHDEVNPDESPDIAWEQTLAEAEEQIFDDLQEADAFAFPLTEESFIQLISENWSRIVELSDPDTIWCFSATPTLLDNVDFLMLEQRGDMVLTYERVGVARINNKTRDEFIKQIQIVHRQGLE